MFEIDKHSIDVKVIYCKSFKFIPTKVSRSYEGTKTSHFEYEDNF